MSQKVFERVVLTVLAVTVLAVAGRIYFITTLPAQPAPAPTPTMSQTEQILVDAMHRTIDAEAIIAGCSAAALRDDRLAAGQLKTNGGLCVQLTGTLQLKTYLGLLNTCKKDDYKCAFASGTAFVLVYAHNVPSNAEEMKALESQIDFDYRSWLENRKRRQ